MNIEVRNRQRKYRINQRNVIKDANTILSLCGVDDIELSILIVNNRSIRELNKKYRGIDKPTDVLAFPPSPLRLLSGQALPSPLWEKGAACPEKSRRGEGGHPRLLGDIVISLEKSHAQAEERGHSPEQEFKILLTHGILHLLGYDHEISRSEAQRMKRKEKIILSKL